jgi:hypothetical protein
MGAICNDCGQDMLKANTCTKGYIILKGKLYKRDTTDYDWNDRCHDCSIINEFGHVHHDGCDVERCPRCGAQALMCDCRENGHTIVGKEYVGKIPKGLPVKSLIEQSTPTKKWHGYARGKKVLELGPGGNPDSRTTHSVDNTPDVKMARYGIQHNPAFKGVKHTFGVDFNKNKLPYPNNMFDLVLSHGVINIGGFIDRSKLDYRQGKNSMYPLQPAFYKEVIRVLKQGGTLEMWEYITDYGNRKKIEPQEIKLLVNFGFKNITFGSGKTHGNKYHITYAKK